MKPPCPIGLVGQAAAGDTRRRGGRLRPRTLGGRHETSVPSLAARLLSRSGPLRPPHRTSVTPRVGPAGQRGLPGAAGAPAVAGASGPLAASAASPPPAPTLELGLVRETLRERIDRTVERLIARGRRDEPARGSTLPARRPDAATSAAPPLPRPVFPKLVPPAREAAAPTPTPTTPPVPAPRARTVESVSASSFGAAPQDAGTPPAAPIPPLPQLVDEIVGELERRVRGQRERRGWLA